MPSLMWATSLLILSLIPIVSVMVIWRERMRQADWQRTLPCAFGEWMRIEDKGPVVGRWGDQDVYAWLRVELADGSFCQMTTERPSHRPEMGRRIVRLSAGAVTYWGVAADTSWGQAPAASASRARMGGFSLIELMIVVVMIGILTAIALPLYRGYVQQSAAKAIPPALMQLAQQVAQFGQDNNTYAGACSTVPAVANAQLSCPAANATGYTVQAVGTGVLSGLSYTLTQSGARATPTAPSGWPTSTSCWVVDASGDCAS